MMSRAITTGPAMTSVRCVNVAEAQESEKFGIHAILSRNVGPVPVSNTKPGDRVCCMTECDNIDESNNQPDRLDQYPNVS